MKHLVGVSTQYLIYQLLIAIEYQTWYHINAKIHTFCLLLSYASYLNILSININENIRNERKTYKMGMYLRSYSYLSRNLSQISNLVPIQSLDNFLLSCYLIDNLSDLNIHANNGKQEMREMLLDDKGSTYKSTFISAADCPEVLNQAQNHCQDIASSKGNMI